MDWTIEFLPAAAKELKALDRTVAARIVRTLEERIAADPRALGSALVGDHTSYGAGESTTTAWWRRSRMSG